MSILENKNILVVGDETSQVHAIEDKLLEGGAVIHRTTCAEASLDEIEADDIDFVLLNHLHEGSACERFLNELRMNRISKVLPIFALVENDETKIEHALMLGAADYFTSKEMVESILQKITLILGEPDNNSGPTTIDITPTKVGVIKTGVKVFIIEDDPLLRNLLSMRFEQSSFPYEFDYDGKNAVAAIKKFKPNVIILDLMLPGRSGFEVLKELKSHSDLCDVPVIVFSNRDSYEDKQKAKKLGAERFFVKAMTDLSELVLTIEGITK